MKFSFEHSPFSPEKIAETGQKLADTVKHLNSVAGKNNYEHDESSINLGFDPRAHQQVKNLAEKYQSDQLKYVVVIGIGGSNLGTMALYYGLRGSLDGYSPEFPKMIFADTASWRSVRDIATLLQKARSEQEFLLILVTKSGTTTESITNVEAILQQLTAKFKKAKERLVIISDARSSLSLEAKKMNIPALSLLEKIGGRFSVFSAVGLFPLAVAGFDIDDMIAGVQEMRNQCLEDDMEKNPALTSAVLQYLQQQRGLRIHNTFFFNPELELIGKWYRQLMGESLGKEKNLSGEAVQEGITPIVSIGSTDLHSMAQLYLAGPRDKFTTFVYCQAGDKKIGVPTARLFANITEPVTGKSLIQVMDSIYGGVKKTYEKKKLPFCEITLSEISLRTLGAFLQFKMMEMIYLAALLRVNCFDQPNVEDYKTETKKLLNG